MKNLFLVLSLVLLCQCASMEKTIGLGASVGAASGITGTFSESAGRMLFTWFMRSRLLACTVYAAPPQRATTTPAVTHRFHPFRIFTFCPSQ